MMVKKKRKRRRPRARTRRRASSLRQQQRRQRLQRRGPRPLRQLEHHRPHHWTIVPRASPRPVTKATRRQRQSSPQQQQQKQQQQQPLTWKSQQESRLQRTSPTMTWPHQARIASGLTHLNSKAPAHPPPLLVSLVLPLLPPLLPMHRLQRPVPKYRPHPSEAGV